MNFDMPLSDYHFNYNYIHVRNYFVQLDSLNLDKNFLEIKYRSIFATIKIFSISQMNDDPDILEK